MPAKTKYVAPKKIAGAKFYSPDRSQMLVIVVTEGKDKFNARASLKDNKEDADKAQTGARASFDTVEKAKKAFKEMVDTAKEKGWNEVTGRSAFDEIPDAPKAPGKKSTARPAHSQPTHASH